MAFVEGEQGMRKMFFVWMFMIGIVFSGWAHDAHHEHHVGHVSNNSINAEEAKDNQHAEVERMDSKNIFAGIGCIFGIAGIVMFVLAKRKA